MMDKKEIIRKTVLPFISEKDKYRLEYTEEDVIKCMETLEREIDNKKCSCCHKIFSGQIFCIDCFEQNIKKIRQGIKELEKGYKKSIERSKNANSEIGKGMWMGASETCKNILNAVKREFNI